MPLENDNTEVKEGQEGTGDRPKAVDDGESRRNFLKGVTTAAAAGTTLLAGCTGGGGGGGGSGNESGGAPSKEAVHYISMEQSPTFQKFWDKTASKFEEENGQKVEITYAWDTGYNERIAQLVQAGNPPDIINLEDFNVGQYVGDNLLRDVTGFVDDFMNEVNFTKEFRIKQDGKDRWWPSFCCPNVRWYRGDVIEDIGFEGSAKNGTPGTFEEWGEFLQMADEANNNLRGGALGVSAELYGTNTALCHLWARGITMSKREGDEVKVALGDHRNDIGEFLKGMKEHYQYAPNTSTWSWTEAIDSFADGKVAEAFYGGARPQLQAWERDRDFAQDVLPGPFPNVGNADNSWDYTFPSGWGFVEGSSQPEPAKKYVASIMMDQDLWMELLQMAPVHNAPLGKEMQDPTHEVWDVDMVNESMTEEQLKMYLDQIPKGRALSYETSPPNPETSDMFMSLGLGNMIFQHVGNNKSVEEAIDTGISDLEESL
ncbi:ABC transporter substrate-binding protein [Halegenticoccus tardaugens]|uniref:ABC transporter substrate-binding protein n=1 Tax=Halegenticoccus tardaugens TaxID=2071624 RepID=UPI00100BA8DA|nr:extracellular solute-binding protein [Halegenticoccus tardaugens]